MIQRFCLIIHYNIYMLRKWRWSIVNLWNQALLKVQTIGMQIVYVTINRKVNKTPKSIQEETSEPLSSSDNRYLSGSRSIFWFVCYNKTYYAFKRYSFFYTYTDKKDWAFSACAWIVSIKIRVALLSYEGRWFSVC